MPTNLLIKQIPLSKRCLNYFLMCENQINNVITNPALLKKSETTTPNDEYENFVNAHLEATTEYIKTKQRAKPKVSWATLAVRKKRTDVKTPSKCNWRNPTDMNALKLKKAQNEFTKKTNRIHTKIR